MLPSHTAPTMTWRQRLSHWDARYAPYTFVAPFFLLFAVFGVFPLAFTMWVSLHDWNLLSGSGEFLGLANYRELMQDAMFWNAMMNTLGMFVLATIPQILLATALAQVLNANLRFRTLWRMGVLLPIVTSVAAVGIIFSLIFARDFGLANWLLEQVGIDALRWQDQRWSSWLAISIMVDWRWTGYNALILLAALQTVPRDLYEAATIDGASAWRQFWSITIPMVRPTLVFVVVIATIGGVQLFTEPLLFDPGSNAMAGGTTNQYQTVAMYLVDKAFTGQRFGYAATIAWVLFLFIAAFSALNAFLIRRIRSAE